jgi:hypothetical protein
MKPILTLALAAIAVPAFAQDLPPASPSAPQSVPASAPDPNAPDPVGGYAPPPAPPAPPGANIQPGLTPDQAFPPPAPLASYPVCKKGQFDNCIQRNDPK